jgi:hypothetical protein
MNRRNFIRVIGLGAVATLASQLLAACGGSGGSSSSGGSGTSSDSDSETFTVTGSVNSGTQTATYSFVMGEQHSAAQKHTTTAVTATMLWNDAGSNPYNVQIQGLSGHPHTVGIPQAGIRTLNSAQAIASSTNSDHDHSCIITLTSLV